MDIRFCKLFNIDNPKHIGKYRWELVIGWNAYPLTGYWFAKDKLA